MYQIPSSIKLGIWTLLLLLLIFGVASLFNKILDTSNTFSFEFGNKALKQIINKNLAGVEGEYAVVIEDLTDRESYALRSFEVFPAASLYKLYLLAAVLKSVDEGSLKLDDEISSSKEYLTQKLGSVDFGYEDREEKIVYTVDEALTRVGRVSDNFASIMLAEKIGWQEVQKISNDLGSKNTQISSSTYQMGNSSETLISTTASDTANFFKKLYTNEVVSAPVSEKVKKYLSLNQIADRIPAGVPQGVEIIHKTGELSRIRHDAGIVYLEGKPYVIVLLSKNLQDENKGVEVMVNISQAVYEYFREKVEK